MSGLAAAAATCSSFPMGFLYVDSREASRTVASAAGRQLKFLKAI